MPNVNLTVYLSDEEYVNYISNKKEINEMARELVKKEVAKVGTKPKKGGAQ